MASARRFESLIEDDKKAILTDAGRILSNLLLKQDLVSETSELFYSFIVGKKSYKMLSGIEKNLRLELIKKEILDKEHV